jgi:hypothetical protein
LGSRHGALASTGVGLIAVIVAVITAGAGHGTYVPAEILFPYTMLSTAFLGRVTAAFAIVALVQFPLYGALVGSVRSSRLRLRAVAILVAIHVAVALCSMVLLRGGSFGNRPGG